MENHKKLLFLDKLDKFLEKLKDIPICEIARVIRENLDARGVAVVMDDDEGTQMGCRGLTREQALAETLVLFKYWYDELIEELDSEK